MNQRWKSAIYVLPLLLSPNLDGTAEATPFGAQCWADGLCRINGCQTPDPDCGPTVPHIIDLVIRRYTTATLSNSNADAILAKATDVLQTDNGGVGDVACDVLFTRDGNVTTFSTGDGSIDSQAEFNTVIGLSGYVKVVNQINWCNGIAFNIVGCAPNGGSSFTAVRFGNDRQEGILWAHEYGHTKGLIHRAGDFVMNATILPKSTRVNTAECNAFSS